MPLLVSLGRELPEFDLGEHGAVDLRYDGLYTKDGRMLARHRHNRWIPADSTAHYVRVMILGPLVALSPDEKTRLGPYEKLAMYNGVAYVEDRVFAFTDLQQNDWYAMSAGQHWPAIRVAFQQGP